MLDNAASFTPFIETWTSEMLPWAQTPAVHGFEPFPPEQQYAWLIAGFAAQPG
jgi:hypothetical protein